MIKAFKNYNPVVIIWLVLLLIVLRICYLFTAPAQVEFVLVESFARALIPVNYEGLIPFQLNLLLAGIVVLIQALLLNHMINFYNLLSKPSFLPALMYVTVSSLFTPFLTLSPPLICNFLVIWMLFKLLAFYKGADVKSLAYDLGMIVAVGSIFYLPYIYFVLVIWIALIIFRPFDWRDWAASIMGYVTVFFFLAVFYYLTGRLNGFFDIWAPLGTRFPNRINIPYYDYLLLIPVAVIIILCMFRLQSNFFRSYILVRKAFQVLFFMFVVAGPAFYVKPDFRLNHFLLCAIPAAIFFSYYFLYATSRWFYESLYILLFAGIIYFQFNTF